MYKRILRSSTIVPPNLYVERAADRQLRAVIEDMGRPAYILVARQMGKTNLLLNMKRKRSDELVVYLDLSNRFDSARSWFRNVIDSIVVAYPDEFQNSEEIIKAQREAIRFEPNAEYDRHLRTLLRETSKRMVIVLDEIDSLVNTTYSDTILAQIRSMYFSRANHEEYERLTYVLSGVIEPTDLIKDKNISPFNIGEKIYLNSFDENESQIFMQNAQLADDREVTSAVFSWCNGNPRMTWDVCAELEKYKANNISLSADIVDKIVNKLYLEEFDRPPVDHIRTLVKSDSTILGAIVSIRYGKADTLDQKTRTKIYLAGITNSAGGTSIRIANKIIDEALSASWLDHSDNTTRSSLEIARESYTKKDYVRALEALEKVLAGLGDSGSLSVSDRTLLATSYLYTGNLTAAMRELDRCISADADPAVIQLVRFYMGVTFRAQAQLTDALRFLRLAADGPNDNVRREAQLTEALIIIGLDRTKFGRDAYSLAVQIVSELEKKETQSKDELSLFVTALYVAAKVSITNQRSDTASHHISRALKAAPPEMIPALLLLEYSTSKGVSGRKQIVSTIVENIFQNQLSIDIAHGPAPVLNKEIFAEILLALAENKLEILFDDAIKYYLSKIYGESVLPFSALASLYADLNVSEPQTKYHLLLARAVDRYMDEKVDIEEKIEVLRELSLVFQGTEGDLWRYRNLYLNELDNNSDNAEFLDDTHLDAIANLATDLEKLPYQDFGRKLFNIWHKRRPSSLAPGTEFFALYIDFLEMMFHKRAGDMADARITASKVLDQLENLKGTTPLGVPATAISVFRNEAKGVLRQKTDVEAGHIVKIVDPFRGFERNEKVFVQYNNMPAVEKKFKMVEADLRSGKCTMVSRKNFS